MNRGFLIAMLVVCVLGYIRAEQPVFWNSWTGQLGLPKALSSPGPDPALLTTGPLFPKTDEERDLIAGLNAETPEFVPMVNAMILRGGDAGKNAWDALDAKVDDYEKKVASSSLTKNDAQLRANIVSFRKDQIKVSRICPCDFGRHRVLVQQLLDDPFPEVEALGREEEQPIDLEYTAVDGRVVDMAQLRGKVVLIDFWAYWCSPCEDEVPLVVAAYNRYRSQGLEIVGVSHDEDKGAMMAYASAHGMIWPQYFYGDHPNDPLPEKFNVGTLPTIWLIDKHGCLVNATQGRDLPEQVEKVLAEQ